MDILLDPKEYGWSKIISFHVGKEHWKQAQNETVQWGNRVVHRVLGILGHIPGIHLVVAVFEKFLIFAKQGFFYKDNQPLQSSRVVFSRQSSEIELPERVNAVQQIFAQTEETRDREPQVSGKLRASIEFLMRRAVDAPGAPQSQTVDLNPSEKKGEATPERMAVLKFLMDRKLILNFVSHPKTLEYFLQEKQRKEHFIRANQPELELLMKKFPSDPLVKRVYKDFLSHLNRTVLPYEEVFMPFLAWGAANIDGVSDTKIIGCVQDLQVKLFKQYFDRQIIEKWSGGLEEEIELFSRDCPLPVFSQIIGPLFRKLIELGGELSDVVRFYSDDEDKEIISRRQERELENIYNPSSQAPILDGIQVADIEFNVPIEIDDSVITEVLQKLSGNTKDAADAVEIFLQKCRSEKFFSRYRVIDLFLEITGGY